MPWQQPWLPAPFLCPAVPWKRRISPGVGGHSLRCPLQVAPQPARFPASLPIEDCGKPRFGEGDPQKVLFPPPKKRPELSRYLLKASLDRSTRGRSLARPRHHLPGAQEGTAGGRGPPPRGAGGSPLASPRLGRPFAPSGARSPVPVPGSCRGCQQRPRSKWTCGKVCLQTSKWLASSLLSWFVF